MEHLAIKSLLISFVIHVMTFSSFIFIIPILNETPKPYMIFLGSILLKSETATLSSITNGHKNKDPAIYNWGNKSPIRTNNLLTFQNNNKPIIFPSHLPKEKRTIKPNYADILQEEKKQKEIPNYPSTDIRWDIGPYKPLKLKIHD